MNHIHPPENLYRTTCCQLKNSRDGFDSGLQTLLGSLADLGNLNTTIKHKKPHNIYIIVKAFLIGNILAFNFSLSWLKITTLDIIYYFLTFSFRFD